MNYTYEGKENAITAEHLRNGETCKVIGYGQSMTPILKSGQPVICEPVTDETVLKYRKYVLFYVVFLNAVMPRLALLFRRTIHLLLNTLKDIGLLVSCQKTLEI